ncbi:alkylhydroperoxidase family enzyme [Marmoricola sp. OAE513]|uniref:carboxymuconolactone decarboxylase family protein n=1 Tax=Marmoricola sp. OAE513 TaxID=2817894 RepID=UPI001AEB413B
MTGTSSLLDVLVPDVASVFAQVAALPAPDRNELAVAEFADQFTLDVASIDAEQRAAFFAATGDQAFAVVQQIYAADFVPRVRAVLDAVLGENSWPQVDPYDGDSWALLEEFMVVVARLHSLDATTTELVRLRGARLHDCAVCKSRRSQDAIAAGADDALFAAVDDWQDSALPEPVKAALGLTDALIWTPYDVPGDVIAAAREHLTDLQVVEVVLDVMRNAANKIAVSLGADAATVTEGVELFTTDADGNLAVVGQEAAQA